jgi:Asp-tRNA(Asn)/Glu-tRNA(Gln) amidotransferase A subunit family amidase
VSEIAYLEIAELAALIRRRMLSPVEATEAMLDRIAIRDGALHS